MLEVSTCSSLEELTVLSKPLSCCTYCLRPSGPGSFAAGLKTFLCYVECAETVKIVGL